MKTNVNKKSLSFILAILLIFGVFSAIPVLAEYSSNDSNAYIQDNTDEFLPVGGLNLPIVTGVLEDERQSDNSDNPSDSSSVEAEIKLPLMRSFIQPAVPGGTLYGYNWISNAANTGANSSILAGIYEALAQLSEIVCQTTENFTPEPTSSGYIYNPGDINVSAEMRAKLTFPTITEIQNAAGAVINLAVTSFMQDNPQYYMYENAWQYGYVKNADGTYTMTKLTMKISPEYALYSKREEYNNIIEKKYQEYADIAGEVSSDFDKARIVHDKILAERDYSVDSGGKPDTNTYAHNILGVLDLRTPGPVCESYAKAYAYILNRLGINTVIVFGTAGNSAASADNHAWNIVEINGAYYYADITWDEREKTNGDSQNLRNSLFYQYFMVGNGNTNFTSKHFPGTPNGDKSVYEYGLPDVSSSDYDTVNGSGYKWLTDDGYLNSPKYNYSVSFYGDLGYPDQTKTSECLFIPAGAHNTWKYNEAGERSFGSYTVGSADENIPVEGGLWLWKYDPAKAINTGLFSNPQKLTQNTDYEIIVEKPYHNGINRAYVYGTGEYRGIDFATVNLKLDYDTGSDTVSDIIIPGSAQGFEINLSAETLTVPANYTIAAYSIDGGNRWKAGTIIPANFPKLFSKELILVVSDSCDPKTNVPTSNALTVIFPKINARPKTNAAKLKINYSIFADTTEVTAGSWCLAPSSAGSAAVYEGYQIAPSANKKTPDNGVWESMYPNGIAVQPNGSAKITYLVRSAPSDIGGTYIPASTPFKITPLAQGKAPKIKADYKKEIIKLSAGMMIFGGSLEQMKSPEAENIIIAQTAGEFNVLEYYTAKKEDKNGINITNILDATDSANQIKQTVCIWSPATDKKPSTQIQEYTLAMRPNAPAFTEIQGVYGKAKLPVTFEFYNSGKKTWGMLPNFTQSDVFENAIRTKATVKATGIDDSLLGFAASKPVNLTVNYGEYTAIGGSVNNGIISLIIGQ